MLKSILVAAISVVSLTAAHPLNCFQKKATYQVVMDVPQIQHHFFHKPKPKSKIRNWNNPEPAATKVKVKVQHLTGFTPTTKLTTDQRVRALALTLFGEARGEGYDGMMAVGWVIMNRINEGKMQFGEYHTEQVVWKYKQFSCWNQNTKHTKKDPNFELLMHIDKLKPGTKSYTRWVQAQQIAYLLIHKKAGVDPTHGGTHYAALKTVRPYWLKDMKKTASLGNHTFYKKRGFFYRLFHGQKI